MRLALTALLLAGCDRYFGVDLPPDAGAPVFGDGGLLPDTVVYDAPVVRCFNDIFDGNSIGTRWQNHEKPTHPIAEINGELVMSFVNATVGDTNGIVSTELFDMTSGFVEAEMSMFPPDRAASLLVLATTNPARIFYIMPLTYGANGFYYGTDTMLLKGHLRVKENRFRISVANGVVTFEASADGLVWASRFDLEDQSGFESSLVYVMHNNGPPEGPVAENGQLAWDNLRLQSAGCVTPPL